MGGLIANQVETPAQKGVVDEFAALTKTKVVEYIPYSDMMIESDIKGKTVIELYPESEIAGIFQRLVSKLAEEEELIVPSPIEVSTLRDWGQRLIQIPGALEKRT